jgi:peptide/nickel transport system substrate-binding protein
MSERSTDLRSGPTRRKFLQTTALAGAAAVAPGALRWGEAMAQGADTLVIAAPATPQGLDIEFDVSLGSIDSLGALYEFGATRSPPRT